MQSKFINTVIQNDVMQGLSQLPAESIDCVVTSPPYWQKRDYGFPEQWGLEETYHEYLNKMWLFMDEIYRVLKPTGTVWINHGDTYANSGNGATTNTDAIWKKRALNQAALKRTIIPKQQKTEEPKKTLLMIPSRFAIGCIDRGWIIRNDIIWGKPNAMPESATDRFSNKYEFLFFMVKQPEYYFDLDAVRAGHKRDYSKEKRWNPNPDGVNPGDVSDFWEIPLLHKKSNHLAYYNFQLVSIPILAGCPAGGIVLDPFCGSGTTLTRAIELGRNCIGIEGSEKYAGEAREELELALANISLFKEEYQ